MSLPVSRPDYELIFRQVPALLLVLRPDPGFTIADANDARLKYDNPRLGGTGFEERYRSPVNAPVLDAAGRLIYIVHRVEDVADYVLGHQQRRDALALRNQEMEAEVVRRFPAPVETTCFRIAQEAVAKALRHARARGLWL